MIRHRMAAAALLTLTLALGACSLIVIGKDPTSPRVAVKNGQVSVSLDPLRFTRADGPTTITWRLPGDGRFSFPENGIVFEDLPATDAGAKAGPRYPASQVFSCKRSAEVPAEFSCLNRNPGPGTYKYTIRVLEQGKGLPAFDPKVINDWD